jgi:hypothetical protein
MSLRSLILLVRSVRWADRSSWQERLPHNPANPPSHHTSSSSTTSSTSTTGEHPLLSAAFCRSPTQSPSRLHFRRFARTLTTPTHIPAAPGPHDTHAHAHSAAMSTVKLTYEGEVDIEKSPREVRLPPTHPHPPPPPPLDTNPLTVPSPCTTDSNHPHVLCASAPFDR